MASYQPLVNRTEAVYRELRSMRMRFRIGAWITLIVGGLLLLLVAFYFSYGYKEISSFRDPEMIVSLVGNMADQQIPALKKMAQDQVNQNASVWAEQASEQVLAQIGPMRKQIESLALQQADEAIAKIDVMGEQKFREILEQNRETVQNAIDQLKNDEEISEGAVIALKESIEREFQIDADSQVDALVTLVSDVNANMEKLATGENLTREQKAERRVLMLARRIHVDRFGDMTTEDFAGTMPVVGELVEDFETKRLEKTAKEASAGKLAEADKEMAADKADDDKEASPEKKPADKPEEEAKPAEKPEKKEAAEKKPAEKPEAKKDKSAEKPEKAAERDKPAKKTEEKEETPAKEKPADSPKEEAKPAEKSEKAPAKEAKPAEKAEEKKEAS